MQAQSDCDYWVSPQHDRGSFTRSFRPQVDEKEWGGHRWDTSFINASLHHETAGGACRHSSLSLPATTADLTRARWPYPAPYTPNPDPTQLTARGGRRKSVPPTRAPTRSVPPTRSKSGGRQALTLALALALALTLTLILTLTLALTLPLGVILYELLTLKRPFTADNMATLVLRIAQG